MDPGTKPKKETSPLDDNPTKPHFLQKFMGLGRLDRVLIIATASLFCLATYLAYGYSPADAYIGDRVRIIYLHIPAAWISYLAFGITFVSSVLYVKKRSEHYDLLSISSVELGVLFCTIAISTGSIFSKITWGTYWNWDPRQTTTLILWFSYAAYLSLRFTMQDPERRARISAVLGVLLFPMVPLSYLSTELYWSLHPELLGPKGLAMSSKMTYSLVISVIAILFLFVYLLRLTLRIERVEIRIKIKKYEEQF